jgi:type VI secretion system secreted protein Hcp
MSSEFHLKIKGVPGESKKQGHDGDIEITSWNFGLSHPANLKGGGASKGGDAHMQEISITKLVDKSSTALAKKCASGDHFPEIVLSGRKTTGDGKLGDYVTITLKIAYITTIGVHAQGGSELQENLSIAFKDINVVYKPQNNKGGFDGDMVFGYNVETGDIR